MDPCQNKSTTAPPPVYPFRSSLFSLHRARSRLSTTPLVMLVQCAGSSIRLFFRFFSPFPSRFFLCILIYLPYYRFGPGVIVSGSGRSFALLPGVKRLRRNEEFALRGNCEVRWGRVERINKQYDTGVRCRRFSLGLLVSIYEEGYFVMTTSVCTPPPPLPRHFLFSFRVSFGSVYPVSPFLFPVLIISVSQRPLVLALVHLGRLKCPRLLAPLLHPQYVFPIFLLLLPLTFRVLRYG